MSIFNYKQRNNITLVIIIALGALIVYSLQGIFGSILSTLVLYTILRPAYIYLAEKKGWNTRFTAVLLLFLSLVILVLPFYGLSSMVITKITELNNDQIYFTNLLNKVKHLFDFSEKASEMIEEGIRNAGTWATSLFPSLISGVFNIVLGLLLMYFLLYFMLVERKAFEQALIQYAPFRLQNTLRFAEEMQNMTYANVLGQGFIALVQGALLSLAFFVLHYTDPLFWGVITMFISFVPVLGPPVIFVPAALMQMADGNSFSAWAMLIFGFVVIINIDNVIRFMIAKKIGNIHPVITVIGVVIGVPLFGILGLVFGPLLFSYFFLLIRIYETSTKASEKLERLKKTPE